MKTLLITLLLSISSVLAHHDSVSDVLHERMVEREAHLYDGAVFKEITEIPRDIEILKTGDLVELINFAQQYDLFAEGFHYALNENTYEIKKGEDVIGYTYSIDISKNDKPFVRRFYIVNKRVDGVFYVGRIVTYNAE